MVIINPHAKFGVHVTFDLEVTVDWRGFFALPSCEVPWSKPRVKIESKVTEHTLAQKKHILNAKIGCKSMLLTKNVIETSNFNISDGIIPMIFCDKDSVVVLMIINS